jgi:hypothetical protein
VYIIVWLVGLCVCWFVIIYLFFKNNFMAKFSLFSEVLEKNLEASFYFSVLQKKKKQWKRCSFI